MGFGDQAFAVGPPLLLGLRVSFLRDIFLPRFILVDDLLKLGGERPVMGFGILRRGMVRLHLFKDRVIFKFLADEPLQLLRRELQDIERLLHLRRQKELLELFLCLPEFECHRRFLENYTIKILFLGGCLLYNMHMVQQAESRRGRRVAVTLSAHLICGDQELSCQTENVSLLGTYVQVARELPISTPAKMTLDLPYNMGAVQCQGVVVRCENLRPSVYGLGVFFNEFLEDGEAKLEKLIDELLRKQTEEAERYFQERDRLRKERMQKKLAEKRKKRRKRGRPRKKRASKTPRKTSS